MKSPEKLVRQTLCAGQRVLAAQTAAPHSHRGPTVFVHGFMGWGEVDELSRLVPYWGLACGDIPEFLRGYGYDCHVASVGPVSSAWDRACELYAQLVGGQVDYGAAHSKKFGHSRWGVNYSAPLFPAWSEDKKIDFITHSFGGATARLFLDILANGRPDEISAAKKHKSNPSPFFEGGRGSWVHSISTISAPHNGTTLTQSGGDMAQNMLAVFTAAAKLMGISDYKGVYDFKLDQFGICRQPSEPLADSFSRILGADFLSAGDNGLDALSAEGAAELNKTLHLPEDVYYFSYPCCRTHDSLLSYTQLPDAGMTPLLTRYALSMGCFRKPGAQWLPNDGLVNTVSAMYPFGSAFKVGSGGKYAPGVWNVMPVMRLDHLAAIGGVFNAGALQTRLMYLEIMQTIDSTYKK